MGFHWRVGVHFGQNVTKNTDYIKKWFKQKFFRIKFPSKTQWTHISIPPPPLELRTPKNAIFKIFKNVLEWERRFTLGPNDAKNTYYIKKMLRTKITAQGRISLSSPRVELGGIKHLSFFKFINVI